jgi:hypothetical protein
MLKVTDILVRGGGGTITFSDEVTIEYIFQFKKDPNIPAGGIFGVTLVGDRADLVYQNVISQSICNMIDWLLQCSSLNQRVSLLEAHLGMAEQFAFTIPDWTAGIQNQIQILSTGTLGPGIIGIHHLGTNKIFHISVFRDDGAPVMTGVDVEFKINLATGQVSLIKAGLGPPFAGRVIIS